MGQGIMAETSFTNDLWAVCILTHFAQKENIRSLHPHNTFHPKPNTCELEQDDYPSFVNIDYRNNT